MAIDAIGEIFNISLGSSATAVSNMLARRVDITTPTVTVVSANEFSIDNVKPAIGVKIDYVAGLNGSNIMLLKRQDVRAIVDILMGMETKDEDFEINELNLSAISEVMNQMMGAASTAMSDFLGEMVNISTPEAFEIQSVNELIDKYFPSEGTLVVVRFQFTIEDAVESEFMSTLTVDLVREMLKGFGISGADVGDDSSQTQGVQISQPDQAATQPQIAVQPEQAAAQPQTSVQPEQPTVQMPQQQPAATQQPPQMQQPVIGQQQTQMPQMPQMQMTPDMQQQYAAMNQGMMYPPYPYPPMYYMQQPQMQQPEPKTIQTSAPSMPKLEKTNNLNEEQAGNLDLLMSVPVDISVEIGRTRRRVKDILNYTKGSLIVLDRLAGDRADLYVNGKCIAKGDIVVVDDSFGLRIAEIIEPLSLEDL